MTFRWSTLAILLLVVVLVFTLAPVQGQAERDDPFALTRYEREHLRLETERNRLLRDQNRLLDRQVRDCR